MQIYSNTSTPVHTITQAQPETACGMDSREKKSNADPSAGVGFPLSIYPFTLEADPLPNLEANSLPNLETNPLPSLQANPPSSPGVQLAPFKFHGVSEATLLVPPSQPFTFELGLTYPTPVLSSDFSPINTSTRSSSTGSVSDLIHQFERLGHEDDEQPARPLHPASPAVDTKAELRRIRREHEYKQVATMHARAEAERVAKEVKRKAMRDDKEAKRHAEAQEQRDNERKPAPFFLPLSPATVAPPQTTFTMTLAYRPTSGASKDLSRIEKPPHPPPVRPVARTPSQSSARDSMARRLQPRHLRDQPTPKGILRKPTDGKTFILLRPSRSVRFNEAVDVREDSGDVREVVLDPLDCTSSES